MLTAGMFALGVVSAILSAAVTNVQHGYYRTARGRMMRFEELLNVKKDLRVDTTPTLGSPIKRIGRITTMLYLVFAVTAALDVAGAVIAITSANGAIAVVRNPTVSVSSMPSAASRSQPPSAPSLPRQ